MRLVKVVACYAVKGGVGKTEATKAIRATPDRNLDLPPADPSYSATDIDLDAAKRSNDRVSKILKSLTSDYEVVILDRPAGLSLLSTNVMRAAGRLGLSATSEDRSGKQ